MSDWKSRYGATDEGAAQAGVYGTPSNMYDVYRAVDATNQINLKRAAESANVWGSYEAPPPIVYHNPLDYSPQTYTYPPTHDTGAHWIDGALKFLAVMSILGVIGGGVYLGWPFAMSVLDAHLERGDAGERVLDTEFYKDISPEAAEWASTPTTRLYGVHLDGNTANWRSLDSNAKRAVEAAWIRYTKDPASFERLPTRQKQYVYATFDSYLSHLSDLGLRQAVLDQEHFGTRRHSD